MFNFFRRALKTHQRESSKLHKQVESFSDDLQVAMGLKDSDIAYMDSENVSFDTERYTIRGTCRCWNGWKPILEAYPLGCCDSSDFEAPQGWFFESCGTDTLVLPTKVDQERILLEALRARQNKKAAD